MSYITKKVETAKRVFQTQGVKGIASVLLEDKLYNQRIKFKIKFNKWFEKKKRWWAGKIVEIRGNTVLIDGCQFNLNSPMISTAIKSHFYFHDYEIEERNALKHFFNPELPVIELGGAIGVIACLTNKSLIHPEKHVVVEANPEILSLLKDNRDRNNCQFTILHGAVAYGTNEVTFNLNEDFWASSAQYSSNRTGTVKVQTINLKQIADKFNFDKFTLICDIEGAEVDMVKFDEEVLRDQVETLMLEVHEHVHGEEPIKNMLLNLEKMNFKSAFEKSGVHVLQKIK